uniref:Regulatory protein zeste n=1 Tax=Anopheles stephensi TaxID=30069 RepID=A0A182Y870_ANOST
MDRKRPISRITNQQLSRLIGYLESEPDVARNLVRGPQNGFWRKVASELNDIGPSRKDVTSWKRAWFDYKCSAKKRVMQYNAAIAAGIYPKHLSPIHKRVIKLLGLEIKKAKLTEETGSGSDVDGAVSDDNMDEAPTPSGNTIRACQKRLAKLPNITIKKHRNDTEDPLGNVGYSSSAPFGASARRRAREATIRKALETNQALITSVNASLEASKEFTAELRTMAKTFEEMNANMKHVSGVLRNLTEVLKSK